MRNRMIQAVQALIATGRRGAGGRRGVGRDRHRRGGTVDRRGSAIVLVLVSVVLLAILAATLLQVTRFERIAQPESNIDIAIESVIAEILSQAGSDIVDNDGNAFNLEFAVGGDDGSGDEPWDFPWTNRGTFGRTAEGIDGNTYTNIIGGVMDDTWLASNEPDFRTTVPSNVYTNNGFTNDEFGVWRQVTLLTGVALAGTTNGDETDLSQTTKGDKNPYELPFTAANPDLPFNRIAYPIRDNRNTLVDADGDGIGDSLWEWTPIKQIGTTRYVMAVRIIDLSARMDVNVATGQYDGGPGQFFGTELGRGNPRGDGPTEMDGKGFVALSADTMGINQAQARSEWERVQGFRLTANPARSLNGVLSYDGNAADPAFPSRRHYWEQGASRVSDRFVRNGEAGGTHDYGAAATFGLPDAFELLQRNGLNSPNFTLLEDLMPTFLRDDGSSNNEDNFVTVIDNGASVTNAQVTGNNWDYAQFWQSDPRKQISPFTGAGVIAPPHAVNQTHETKLDVNEAMKTLTGLDEIREQVREVLAVNYPYATTHPHLAGADEFASQLTANLKDYADPDNRITVVDNHAGFEALPYISEVYTQRLYMARRVIPPTAPATNDTVVWSASRGSPQGYAIEIGNPYARFDGTAWIGRPVSLEHVWIKLGDGAAAVELSSLPGMPPDNKLDPGETLVLYHNTSGNSNNPDDDDLLNLITTTKASGSFTQVYEVDVTGVAGMDMPANQQSVTVQLRAEEQDAVGTALNWSYSACDIELPPNTINEEVPQDTIVQNVDQAYAQGNFQGVGQGLRMMTVMPGSRTAGEADGFGDDTSTYTKPSENCDDSGPAVTPAPGTGAAELNLVPALGDEDKPTGPTGYVALALPNQQIVWQDNPRDRLQWIGDLLQVPVIGPDPARTNEQSTTAQAFRDAGLRDNAEGIKAMLIPYKTSTQPYQGSPAAPTADLAPLYDPGFAARLATGNGGYGVYAVPHAVMLMERLTTFNPSTDGEDANDDGITGSIGAPDEAETLVPGKINLNTASELTLQRVLPFPDLATRQAVAKAIVERRESMDQFSDHGLGADDLPGIAYPSSLYEHLTRLPNNYVTGYANPAMDNADTTQLSGTRIDWNDYEDPTALGTFPGGEDGVIDDREEEVMLAKWLSEVANTRSDVFAAYIVVQGYPANDFTVGPLESARLIVIFSRANVRENGDRAVEIGRFRFK